MCPKIEQNSIITNKNLNSTKHQVEKSFSGSIHFHKVYREVFQQGKAMKQQLTVCL